LAMRGLERLAVQRRQRGLISCLSASLDYREGQR
jgi:hypothetical protein